MDFVRHWSEKTEIGAGRFIEWLDITVMTHVRISPFYPQSNGKIERWHKSFKGESSGQEHRYRSMMRGV